MRVKPTGRRVRIQYLSEAGVSGEEAYGQLVGVARVAGDGLRVEVAPPGRVDVEAPLRAGDVDDRPVQRHHLEEYEIQNHTRQQQ